MSEFRTDNYGRFIRDGELAPPEDFVQVPMEEYERLKTVESCYNKTIELSTARTIYQQERELTMLKRRLDRCDVCPYKQAVQSMTKEFK